MRVTAIYAGLLALLYIGLAFRVILYRRPAKVELADGGDRELLRRIRVHANFAEYVPFALLLMAFSEILGIGPARIHLLGGILVVGRLVHAYGLSQTPHILAMRVGGVIATLAVIGASALACLWLGGVAAH